MEVSLSLSLSINISLKKKRKKKYANELIVLNTFEYASLSVKWRLFPGSLTSILPRSVSEATHAWYSISVIWETFTQLLNDRLLHTYQRQSGVLIHPYQAAKVILGTAN